MAHMDRITARRVDLEIAKLVTEAQKLGAETLRLNAEADKLIRERWWYPGLLLSATIGTTAAVVKLILS